MRMIKKYFNKMKLKNKILLSITCVFLLCCFILFFFFYSSYTNQTKTRARQYGKNVSDQIVSNLDSFISVLESSALSISYNKFMQESIMNRKSNETYDNYKNRQYILNVLDLFAYSIDNINISVFIIENNGYSFYSSLLNDSNTSYVNENYDITEDKWFLRLSQTESNKIFFPENPQNYIIFEEKAVSNVYTLAYKILDFYDLDVLGYVLIDIDKEYFESIFFQNNLDMKDILLLDENSNLILSKNKDSDLLKHISSNGIIEKNYINSISDEYMIFQNSTSSDWKLINSIYYENLLDDANTTKYIFFILPFFVLTIGLIISILLSKNISRPIVKVVDAFHEVKKGNFDMQIENTYSGEAKELLDGFNTMTKTIQGLVEKNEAIAILKKDTELKSLQRQLNPHFLYNTLEIIIGLIVQNDKKSAVKICENLGNMLRYNLEDATMVTIEEEINQIKNYTNIMNERLDKNLQCTFYIDSDIKKHYVLKFILQPFIENSLTHGFENKVENNKIEISAKKIKNTIKITISDNGKGMDKETVIKTMKILKSYNSQNIKVNDIPEHLGILNVHFRLLLNYGDNYFITITSSPECGTKVILVLPDKLKSEE